MKIEIITPKPYFKIAMQVSHRRFHDTRKKLWEIGEDIDESQEIRQGYVSEKLDYEGDLESIRIYNCKETAEYIKIIKKEFGVEQDIPKGMDIVFSVL
ncbi:conserved hypothetical protein [Tenacibaculum finnmarkense genomovar ulcerans]|uniref:Uncharacterized protein n=1 Tax=Tenacibaculum finnmarkense genomovar ulcerans TaxID=2781388 RepID=A0A2I2MA78_9FLAO|nr:hypothetical protein [Tenacibaculum finnmarkense]SOU89442.1 conserved hypothetical protein [Tenacibaculum finnmarkense genomovar ulcerans]